jgi:hypothetical protein
MVNLCYNVQIPGIVRESTFSGIGSLSSHKILFSTQKPVPVEAATYKNTTNNNFLSLINHVLFFGKHYDIIVVFKTPKTSQKII